MKKYALLIAALATIVIAAPSIASAETVIIKRGGHHHGYGARAQMHRDNGLHRGWHRGHRNDHQVERDERKGLPRADREAESEDEDERHEESQRRMQQSTGLRRERELNGDVGESGDRHRDRGGQGDGRLDDDGRDHDRGAEEDVRVRDHPTSGPTEAALGPDGCVRSHQRIVVWSCAVGYHPMGP